MQKKKKRALGSNLEMLKIILEGPNYNENFRRNKTWINNNPSS